MATESSGSVQCLFLSVNVYWLRLSTTDASVSARTFYVDWPLTVWCRESHSGGTSTCTAALVVLATCDSDFDALVREGFGLRFEVHEVTRTLHSNPCVV